MEKTNNSMLRQLLAGIIIYGVMGSLIILLCIPSKGSTLIGFLSGIVLACFMVWHMNQSIQHSLLLDEAGALKHTRKMVIVRSLVMILAFAVLFLLKAGNVVAALFGLFSLKISAYMNPIFQKFMK